MCNRCGTGSIAWCADPYRHGESIEPVEPGEPPVTRDAKVKPTQEEIEAGLYDDSVSLQQYVKNLETIQRRKRALPRAPEVRADFYVDDTDVEIDNRDLRTTNIQYGGSGLRFIVDTRFALSLVENALENAMPGEQYQDVARSHIAALYRLLNR